MNIPRIIIAVILLVGCERNAVANEDTCLPQPQAQKVVIRHPIGRFLEEAPSPFGIASYTLYHAQLEKSQQISFLERPAAAWLLLRVMPRPLPSCKSKRSLLMGAILVILPGFFLRTFYKKKV